MTPATRTPRAQTATARAPSTPGTSAPGNVHPGAPRSLGGGGCLDVGPGPTGPIWADTGAAFRPKAPPPDSIAPMPPTPREPAPPTNAPREPAPCKPAPCKPAPREPTPREPTPCKPTPCKPAPRVSTPGDVDVAGQRARVVPLTWLTGLALLALPLPPPERVTAPVPAEVARIAPGGARQVVDVRARGSYATVTAWERQPRTGAPWRERYGTKRGRVGANGVVAGAGRRQGTSTTPDGTYALTRAFGVGADPGTALPYHRVTP
jgi:hypothetical protein